jgi:hypothetical protein
MTKLVMVSLWARGRLRTVFVTAELAEGQRLRFSLEGWRKLESLLVEGGIREGETFSY